MTVARYQRCSGVETLELPVCFSLNVQALPVMCGGGVGPRNRRKHEAWFNPSQYAEWFAASYWRDPQACRVALTASPDANVASNVGFRLPITWGSSAKH